MARPIKAEKAPTTYPILKRGRELDCTACNKGKVLTSSGIKDCKGCKGSGKIKVK